MQNFSEDYMLEYVLAGEVALPKGDVPAPWIDTDDIADVAVAALTDGSHVGQLYDLTGPGALSIAEAVAEIAKATGRELSYVPITIEESAVAAAELGVAQEIIDLLTHLYREVLVESNATVGDGVQRALGRPPRDFSEFARDTAATGVWNVEDARVADSR